MELNPTPVELLSYEQAFAELETLVAVLETNPPALDETMRLYERGQALSKHCADLLDQAELKVRVLSGEQDFESGEKE